LNIKITTEPFGSSPATLIKIANDTGSVLTLTDLGATVVALEVPARRATSGSNPASGRLDVVLGYGNYDDYLSGDKYFGATIGRCANRIARGELTIGDSAYELDKNQAGGHTLHSGSDGWHVRIWPYDIGADSVTFTMRSPDGDQGFPGAADVNVTYTLTDENTVRIAYHAVSDADTAFNLTNHAYFNLDGEGAGSVRNHLIRINSSYFVPTDADSIPTGDIRDVTGSVFDFRREKRIGRDIDADDEQLALAGGYDHNFVIDGYYDDSGAGAKDGVKSDFGSKVKKSACENDGEREKGSVTVSTDGRDRTTTRELRTAAVVRSETTGVEMTVRTDLPGVQFYTGNHLGADNPSKSGAVYERRSGFCLETQFFPDAPHHTDFPSIVFRAGEPFDSVTEYSFSLA
jgi:aldose 1-epimerase